MTFSAMTTQYRINFKVCLDGMTALKPLLCTSFAKCRMRCWCVIEYPTTGCCLPVQKGNGKYNNVTVSLAKMHVNSKMQSTQHTPK